MDSIVLQIRELVNKADADSRGKIVQTLESLLAELRDPVDILYDAYASVRYSVSSIFLAMRSEHRSHIINSTQMVTIPMASIGVDIGLFQKLAAIEPGSSRTTDQLANDTGADVDLLGECNGLQFIAYSASMQLLMGYVERILRYLASINYVQEVGVDRYTANKLTHILATPMVEAALAHR